MLALKDGRAAHTHKNASQQANQIAAGVSFSRLSLSMCVSVQTVINYFKKLFLRRIHARRAFNQLDGCFFLLPSPAMVGIHTTTPTTIIAFWMMNLYVIVENKEPGEKKAAAKLGAI